MGKQMTACEKKESTVFRGEIGVFEPLDLKLDATDETGEFEGYASVFGNRDRGDDIVMPGAFTKTLKRLPIEKVKMLWYHDPRDVIGKWLEAEEDKRGLKVKGRLNLKVAKAAELHALMTDGAVDGMSIGYRPNRWEDDRTTGARKLIEIELAEISLVTFPMNESALVRRVKSGRLPTKRDLEDMLKRDAGLSSQQAKAFIADGYKALTAERDAGESEEELLGSIQRLSDALRG